VLLFRVDILKGTYSGQKLIALVRRKMMAKMPRTVATTPDSVPVINSMPIRIATVVLIILSVAPTFFFIVDSLE